MYFLLTSPLTPYSASVAKSDAHPTGDQVTGSILDPCQARQRDNNSRKVQFSAVQK